jgi:hypothetical protein
MPDNQTAEAEVKPEPPSFTYPDGKTINVECGKIQATPGVYASWDDIWRQAMSERERQEKE